MPGLVPQVTNGASRAASISIIAIKQRVFIALQTCASDSTLFPTPHPPGQICGPSRYAKVVSSGAIMPARAPASMLMLHIVIRPSIESARTASRVFDHVTVAPSVPMWPMIASARSLAVTPRGKRSAV